MQLNLQSRLFRRVAGLTAAAALCFGLAFVAVPVVRWVDIHFLHEALKDIWGCWRHGEDWGQVAPLPQGLDYGWLHEASTPLLVAHALGESGQPAQNTIAALRRSIGVGLRLLEVDVWLDDVGLLRCHHGPEPPSRFSTGDCTLAEALRSAADGNAWLVLDIKTDFAITGAAIVKQFVGNAMASRLVFQLYRPSDVPLFAAWAAQIPLPGPLITTYLANRSLRHIARHAPRLGVQVMTIPLYRGAALGRRRPGLVLLIHPVHDCEALVQAKSLSADGVYTQSALVLVMRESCRS